MNGLKETTPKLNGPKTEKDSKDGCESTFARIMHW